MIEIDVDMDVGGPMFDGSARTEVSLYLQEIEDTLGHMGRAMVRAYLPTQYKYLGHNRGTPKFNPVPPNAGYLEGQIYSYRETPERVIVTETDVIYGPWIEGIHPGNFVVLHKHRDPPPRRFPGYHAFRKISQSLESMAGGIADRDLAPYLEAMNG